MVRSALETAPKNRQLSATVKDLHQEFSESVKDLKETQEWEKMLEGASKFHHYSLRNMMLILRQNPEATQCAGYTTWKKLGYQVRKGEKGLKILAPRTLVEKDSQGNPRRNDAGDIIRKKVFEWLPSSMPHKYLQQTMRSLSLALSKISGLTTHSETLALEND